MSKKLIKAIFLIFFIVCFHSPTAHAGFFIFNIINGIFNGDHKDSSVVVEPPGGVVKFGMKNNDVLAMQEYLIKLNYLSGKADGVFGYQTLSAVKAFQRDSGLVEDGIVGQRTMNDLKRFKNNDVLMIQQYLIKANYLSDKADGVFGYRTLSAVKAFQRDSGLVDDGVVGPQTMSALKKFKGTRPKNSASSEQSKKILPPTDSGVPPYQYALQMLVTAYTRYDAGCTDYTYRGTYLHRGLCAVDPNIIPFGTKLYVPGYGEAIADDIGGAIQGNHIDVAMDSLDEAFNWGSKTITVYVLSGI